MSVMEGKTKKHRKTQAKLSWLSKKKGVVQRGQKKSEELTILSEESSQECRLPMKCDYPIDKRQSPFN